MSEEGGEIKEKKEQLTEPMLRYSKINVSLLGETKVPISKFFQFATSLDIFLMIIGIIASAGNGASIPIFAFLFGNMTTDIYNEPDNLMGIAWKYSELFLILGVISFVLSYISMATWMTTGERQSIAFRVAYFRALLRQEIAWYDSSNVTELSMKVANDCYAIKNALGEKIGTIIHIFSLSVVSFTVAFYRGWELTAILCGACVFGLLVIGTMYVWGVKRAATLNNKAYEAAGGVAEQSLAGIRTVRSLNGEEREIKAYGLALDGVRSVAIKYGCISGYSLGFLFFCMIGCYSLGMYFGARFVQDGTGNYDAGTVITIFFSVTMGIFMLATVSPIFKSFSTGKEALNRVQSILDRSPPINVENNNGSRIEDLRGEIKFERVTFAYPNRLEQTILKEVSLVFPANRKISIVGESGCGKSTCMQLIERYYDPASGTITIDDHNIKTLNLRFLRNIIGYVGQEPVLFGGTIKENLLLAKEDATDEQIFDALKKANAYEFVMSFPNKLGTYIGSGGTQLSGGQKQRIAIARVILRNPQILLLDEATSALDIKSEAEIQATLDQLVEGRTTIVISHRMSTIQNSDKIILMERGQVMDQGTHGELYARNLKYKTMVNLQKTSIMTKEEESSSSEENKVSSPQNNTIETVNNSIEDRNDVSTPRIALKRDDSISTANNQSSFQEASIQPNMFRTRQKSHSQKFESVQGRIEKKFTVSEYGGTKEFAKDIISENESLDMVEGPIFRKGTEEMEDYLSPIDVKSFYKTSKFTKCQILRRLFKANKTNFCNFVLCFTFAIITGAIFPLFAVAFSYMLQIMNNPQDPDFLENANLLSFWFLIMALGFLVSLGSQTFLGTIIGENLTKTLRSEMYAKMLHMDMMWFDMPENAPGRLSSRLTTEPSQVNGLISSVLAITIQSISSLLIGIAVAFWASWRVSVITFVSAPFVLIASYFFQEFVVGFSAKDDKAYNESAGFLTDILTNMRTVNSLNQPEFIINKYRQMLTVPLVNAKKKSLKAGIAFGASQFFIFAVFAVTFFAGIYYLNQGQVTFRNMFCAVFGLVYAAVGSGSATQFMPDVGSAFTAGNSIFNLLDQNIMITEDPNTSKDPIRGEIEFKNLSFIYPTRPGKVLKNVSFKVKLGQKVGLVGPSGSGKSTIVQLLLRFYDPIKGDIFIDGKNIKDISLKTLREAFGYVAQEPILFNGSIEDNIKYTSVSATPADILYAARRAHASEFIEATTQSTMSVPTNLKYKRQVGSKGSQLSGGQKQRIAIARIILRNPKIFLFDEATSALDSQNEKIVQDSLDEIIVESGTAIVIAHRISTIHNCDNIIVFLDGSIVEAGNYVELNEKKGIFYRLERGQQLNDS